MKTSILSTILCMTLGVSTSLTPRTNGNSIESQDDSNNYHNYRYLMTKDKNSKATKKSKKEKMEDEDELHEGLRLLKKVKKRSNVYISNSTNNSSDEVTTRNLKHISNSKGSKKSSKVPKSKIESNSSDEVTTRNLKHISNSKGSKKRSKVPKSKSENNSWGEVATRILKDISHSKGSNSKSKNSSKLPKLKLKNNSSQTRTLRRLRSQSSKYSSDYQEVSYNQSPVPETVEVVSDDKPETNVNKKKVKKSKTDQSADSQEFFSDVVHRLFNKEKSSKVPKTKSKNIKSHLMIHKELLI